MSDILLRVGLLGLLPYIFLALWYWRVLRPQLLPAARRLAYFLCVCQLLLLLIHTLTVGQIYQLSRYFWHFNGEFNIPSSFATLQLALVASQALALALALRPQVEWRYWLGVSAFFFLLAIDEYVLLHEWGNNVELFYLLYGILLTGFTWRWLAREGGPEYARMSRWILFGLAISAIGAMIIDRVAPVCPEVDDVCTPFYILEEVLEFSGIMVVAVVVRGVALRAIPEARRPVFGRRIIATLGLMALIIYSGGRVIFPVSERVFLPYRPPILRLSGATVEGLSAGETATVQVDIIATQALPAPLGYSLQLTDPITEQVWATADQWSALEMSQWPVNEPISQDLSLEVPEDVPTNRALWLVLYLWWHDGIGYWNLPFYGGGFRQIAENQILLDEITLPGPASIQEGGGDVFAMGFTLLASDIPERVRVGETLSVTFHWQADEVGQEDWQQFLHFTHEESGALWNHDQPPLGARLPTRHWYVGLADQERWQFTLPADLAPGRYQLHTGLYRLSDLQRAPVWMRRGCPGRKRR